MRKATISDWLSMIDLLGGKVHVQQKAGHFLHMDTADLRTFVENELRDYERSLQRYEHTLESIQMLVWPDLTDVQADAPDYLVKLVAKVGALVRSQAWDVERKHVVANRKLAVMVQELRAQIRRERARAQALEGERDATDEALGVSRHEKEVTQQSTVEYVERMAARVKELEHRIDSVHRSRRSWIRACCDSLGEDWNGDAGNAAAEHAARAARIRELEAELSQLRDGVRAALDTPTNRHQLLGSHTLLQSKLRVLLGEGVDANGSPVP